MEIALFINSIVILLTVAIGGYYIYLLNGKLETLSNSIKEANSSIKKVHERIDKIFVVDSPSPNEAMNPDQNQIDLSETHPNQIPRDVKFEVEGGDSQVPPGREEV